MKERRGDWGGGGWGGGRLIKGGDYFKYFHQRKVIIRVGDLSRDGYFSRKYGKQVINSGR